MDPPRSRSVAVHPVRQSMGGGNGGGFVMELLEGAFELAASDPEHLSQQQLVSAREMALPDLSDLLLRLPQLHTKLIGLSQHCLEACEARLTLLFDFTEPCWFMEIGLHLRSPGCP